MRSSGPQPPIAEVAVLAKQFDRAKSRLEFFPPQRRSRLAEAMLLDTLAAVLPIAGRVLVVSGEPALEPRLVSTLGTHATGHLTVTDDPGELNAAVAAADAWFDSVPPLDGTAVRIAMVADLPAITATEFAAVVAAAAAQPRSFVADASGTGTTAVCATRSPLVSRFGVGSAVRHRAAGLAELSGPWPGARHDVDVLADLAQVCRLGVGLRTAAVVDEAVGSGTTHRS